MYRYTIEWKSYPMDRSGVKSPMKGVVTFDDKQLIYADLHDEVRRRVVSAYPKLSDTPILINLLDRRIAKEAS